jgi:hypothetical protein
MEIIHFFGFWLSSVFWIRDKNDKNEEFNLICKNDVFVKKSVCEDGGLDWFRMSKEFLILKIMEMIAKNKIVFLQKRSLEWVLAFGFQIVDKKKIILSFDTLIRDFIFNDEIKKIVMIE